MNRNDPGLPRLTTPPFARRAAVLAAAIVLAWMSPLRAAGEAGFSGSLGPAERAAVGLDKLTPAQLAALDAAVDAYRRAGETVAAERAARTAVADYQRREEPKIVARAVAVAKREQPGAERIEAQVVGPFSGWDGRTVFELDNGQVWKQVGPDIYYASPEKNAPVEIYRSKYGSYRLHVRNGAWVTVTRLR